jgi:anthranilate phosphoribosyltransferase
MKNYLERISRGSSLTQEESRKLFDGIVKGELGPVEIASLLTALKMKGESSEEIAGAAQALRESAVPFPCPDYPTADTCGTGGDGANTINVSTAVALVAAEMGIPIVKHGNRSVSSACGSADVLEALGVGIKASPETSRRSLDSTNICFLFAPMYHLGMKHAMPVRQALGIRTIFNIVGPLANPASPNVQIIGVYSPSLCFTMARTLQMIGCERALVVHGSGLDEIALHGTTKAVMLTGGELKEIEITPEEAGLKRYPIENLRGGDAMKNARAIARILAGKGDEAHEAAVAINAGALAWIFGKADDLKSGTEMAIEAMKSGGAAERLKKFAEASNGP